jgi:electron transfer flavoprotein beta subunit
MKIVICVKRVPDTASKIKVGKDAKSIETKDLEYVVSPYDEYAVEYAVQIKEKNKDVELVIMSVGTPDAEKIIRKCLSMGADRGVLLETSQDLYDPFGVASVLVKALAEEKPDAVFFGIKAVDDDNAQIGAMVATLLQLPFIDAAVSCELVQKAIKAKVEVEGGHQILEASLPCALSMGKAEVAPRISSLINIKRANQKPLKKVAADLPSATFQVEKLELPPERQGGKILGQGADVVPELFRRLREEAKVL